MHALRGALIGRFLVGCTHRHDVRRLDRPEAIPGALGQRVEVVGVLEERHDLPVFVLRAGEPTIAGIPVPEGTALHAASRRFVLTQPQWRVLR